MIELRPAQMDALRVYTNLALDLRVPPADGLIERVHTAYFDRPGNRWRMTLTRAQTDSVAYAFYLRALTGSVVGANWFAREYGVTYRADSATGRPGAVPRPQAVQSAVRVAGRLWVGQHVVALSAETDRPRLWTPLGGGLFRGLPSRRTRPGPGRPPSGRGRPGDAARQPPKPGVIWLP
ncbi:DUF6417 family protein [Streptomyces sp. NPDC028635]|uniref:DUF6417 family protein n=1 Tax=Streptomyces sp. NPDC028635 TaxID=3154800 RepID=UPI0033C043AA